MKIGLSSLEVTLKQLVALSWMLTLLKVKRQMEKVMAEKEQEKQARIS